MDYYQRLLDDADALSDRATQGSPIRMQIAQAQTRLDLSLAQQLLSGNFIPMASIRGAGETFVRSSRDGTMEPVAVYVPQSYSPERPAPLVVFLHGRNQPETGLVAPLFIQEIAEQTGSIVIAPYGRAYWEFGGAESDIYDALDAATKAFAVAPGRRYLAGYSMGGFSVFKVAALRPEDWSALLCISGMLLTQDAKRFLTARHYGRIYVVTGVRDDVVPTRQSTATATFLSNAGFDVSFYSQPDGTHGLYSLHSSVAQAWSDMMRGTIRPVPNVNPR